MKHKWKPSGIAENKFCEATCAICHKLAPFKIKSAHWMDTDGIMRYWEKLEKLNDCSGEIPKMKGTKNARL